MSGIKNLGRAAGWLSATVFLLSFAAQALAVGVVEGEVERQPHLFIATYDALHF